MNVTAVVIGGPPGSEMASCRCNVQTSTAIPNTGTKSGSATWPIMPSRMRWNIVPRQEQGDRHAIQPPMRPAPVEGVVSGQRREGAGASYEQSDRGGFRCLSCSPACAATALGNNALPIVLIANTVVTGVLFPPPPVAASALSTSSHAGYSYERGTRDDPRP